MKSTSASRERTKPCVLATCLFGPRNWCSHSRGSPYCRQYAVQRVCELSLPEGLGVSFTVPSFACAQVPERIPMFDQLAVNRYEAGEGLRPHAELPHRLAACLLSALVARMQGGCWQTCRFWQKQLHAGPQVR